MIKRLILGASAVAVIATAAAVVVVAAAFSVYALLEPEFGAAGAAGLLALITAALLAVVGLIAWMKLKPAKAKAPPQGDMVARAVNLARERPIIAAAGVVAAAIIGMRNPALTALVVKSFMDSKKPPKR